MKYDTFLSYASEDGNFARELAGALRARGLRIWYAETELKVGDSLVESIDRGLQESSSGVLLISSAYLNKGWPQYELDVLMRQRIEHDHKLFPVWHNISKDEVEKAHPGLAGIFALQTDRGFRTVVTGLLSVLSPAAVTFAQTSSWEDPLHRFLKGEGEATLVDGGTFTIWEALIHFPSAAYPIKISSRTFSRDDLVFHAYESLIGDLSPTQMDVLYPIYEQVKETLADAGADLTLLAYDELPD